MISALIDDVAQRVISGNKLEQQQYLISRLREMKLPQGAKVLDFGCGTALFANTIMDAGFDYTGYDIDPAVIGYAKRLYRGGTFTADANELSELGPFDLVLANCCFHHIEDGLIEKELDRFRQILKPGGRFLLIDLLLRDDDPHLLRRAFRKLERGAYVRKSEGYERLVTTRFKISDRRVVRTHVFSLKGNPLYQDLVVLLCTPN
jgi:SAM-dependent methyltransferase